MVSCFNKFLVLQRPFGLHTTLSDASVALPEFALPGPVDQSVRVAHLTSGGRAAPVQCLGSGCTARHCKSLAIFFRTHASTL